MRNGIYTYHYQVGFPTNLRKFEGVYDLVYAPHALDEAKLDRYGFQGTVVLPKRICFEHIKLLVEVDALADGTMLKGVYRIKYNALYDLVIAVELRDGVAYAKTVWLNSVKDKHETLNWRRYDEPIQY
jgi:hypothetical protein